MKFSVTGQGKGDLLIQVTAWSGLTILTVMYDKVESEFLTAGVLSLVSNSSLTVVMKI